MEIAAYYQFAADTIGIAEENGAIPLPSLYPATALSGKMAFRRVTAAGWI